MQDIFVYFAVFIELNEHNSFISKWHQTIFFATDVDNSKVNLILELGRPSSDPQNVDQT